MDNNMSAQEWNSRMRQSNAVRFYDPVDGTTGFLTNFYRASFDLDGHMWPTVEHYYQAQKFAGTPLADKIRLAETPRAAKNLGRSMQEPLRADWSDVKRQVMLHALVAKFLQNPPLIERLLGTRDQLLMEANPTDTYWGEGNAGQGSNHLGRLLMVMRGVLPRADHANMQVHGDGTSLQERWEDLAWEALSDAQCDPNAYEHPLSVNVLRTPLFGQGVEQSRAVLQPLIGRRVLACSSEINRAECSVDFTPPPSDFGPRWVRRLYRLIKGGEPIREFTLSGVHDMELTFRAIDGTTVTEDSHHLLLSTDLTLRMGNWPVQSLKLTDRSDIERRSQSLSAESAPTRWDLLEELGNAENLTLIDVWIVRAKDYDPLVRYYYQPVCEAIALCLERRSTHETEPQKFYVGQIVSQTDGQIPCSFKATQLPVTPNQKPWQFLLSTGTRGMERIEASFAKSFEHWGFELPVEDVVMRRAGEIDDGMDGTSGWSITYRFGRDEHGEYLDYESDHRMCGPSVTRIYAIDQRS